MKGIIPKLFLPVLIGLFFSCVSTNEPYNPEGNLSPIGLRRNVPAGQAEDLNFTVMGSVQVTFTGDNGMGSSVVTESIRQRAYILLKEEASKNYQGIIDVRNIVVAHVRNYYPNQEWIASGDVFVQNETAAVESSLAKAAGQIMESLQSDLYIAIVYVASNDTDMAEYIANELEYIMVNEGFTIVDRSQLDKIRQEQDLQLSWEVDDDTAVSIGKIAGANIIITGSVTGMDSMRRLRLRALNVQTAQVLAVASERL